MKILVGMPSPDSWGGPAACEPPFVEALRNAGNEVSEFTYVYGEKEKATSLISRIRRVVRSARSLRRAVMAERFDVVHLNTAFDLKTILRDAFCIFWMPLGRHRLFLKMHGSDARAYIDAGPILKRLVRCIARRADAIGVLSSEERGDFIELGFEREKIYRVLNVVEVEEFPAKIQSRKEEVALLFVSRLIATKGLLETIRAARILKDDGVIFSLTVVGDGDIRAEAEALVGELGLAAEIHFTGYIAESAVAEYLAASDIFVFPTRHPEGFPIALYKAAIAGLPIVTTKVRSAADLLTDEENCLFCTTDPQDIMDKIRRLIGDEGLRKFISENNRKFREMFARTRVADEYLRIYREIASRN